MLFDATGFYQTAFWDEKSIYPNIETGYAFTSDMNNELVKISNTQSFAQGSGSLKIKSYSPLIIIINHMPNKEIVGKLVEYRLRNGSIIDTLTSVDIQLIVEIGGRVIEIYEGVIYDQFFKTSPLKKFIEKLFEIKNKFKCEGRDVMQLLVKFIMNPFYGQTIGKDFNCELFCKTVFWMETNFDDVVKGYCMLPNGGYFVKNGGR